MKLSIEEAIFKRGFLISSSGGILTLCKGSHEFDQADLFKILDHLTINYEHVGNGLRILDEVKQEQLQSILLFPAKNHETNVDMSYGSWKNFTRRKHGPKARTIVLESGVAILVKALSAVGISTVSSCDGHGNRSPGIDFASYHNAVWFEYLQENYLNHLTLHYKWEVKLRQANQLAYLTAVGTSYDVSMLQEDSSKMAKMLLDHDEMFRGLKSTYFSMDKKPTKRRLKDKSYESTKEIMNEIIKENVV
jgi:hypothetical protein